MVKKVERQLRGTVKQENITISTDKLKKQLQRVKNGKAPGPDELLGCWIKTFISCHNRMAAQLQLCFEMNEIPNWLTTGKTVLISKDREKRNDVTNFRPITCVRLMWKIFTRLLSKERFDHQENERLLPEEQKVPKKIEGDKGPINN